MTEQAPANYTFRVEIFTNGLLVRGSFDMPIYRRLSDALNGDPRRYLVLRDATLAPFTHLNQVQRVPELLVERSEALIVATLEEPQPPPDYYNSAELERTPVHRDAQAMLFFTSQFALRGQFHKRPDLTLMETLERSTDDFVPLSSVQIFPLGGTGQPASHDFACVNRAHIIALCAVPGPALPPPAVPEIPTETHSLPADPPEMLDLNH